jgi:hypothetical protein
MAGLGLELGQGQRLSGYIIHQMRGLGQNVIEHEREVDE